MILLNSLDAIAAFLEGGDGLSGIDSVVRLDDCNHMKTATLESSVNWWPVTLEVQSSRAGLVLRPHRKARAGWAKAFRRSSSSPDDLAFFRQSPNNFDLKEWQW
jgi:hypothetical protein